MKLKNGAMMFYIYFNIISISSHAYSKLEETEVIVGSMKIENGIRYISDTVRNRTDDCSFQVCADSTWHIAGICIIVIAWYL